MANSLPQDRATVRRGGAIGLALAFIVFFTGYHTFPVGQLKLISVADKLVYTLRWQSLSIFTFIFGIVRVANVRSSTNAIDPIEGRGEHLVASGTRYLQNTLEQFVLSITGHLILSTYLDDSVIQRVIPSLVITFVIGRVLFFYGYMKNPLQRAPGFAMTFLLNVAIHLYCLYCLVFYGPGYGFS